LRRLRERFPEELVVIGVHSAKFQAEKATANLRQAVMRLGIEHPVVNDEAFRIWDHFAVKAWPTLVLIDPEGKVVAAQSGEIDAAATAERIAALIEASRRRGVLTPRPPAVLPRTREPTGALRYPSKVLAAPGGLLYAADTGHHRVLEIQLGEGGRCEVLRAFTGTGTPSGTLSGDPSGAPCGDPGGGAGFRHPRGLALRGRELFVADTDHHRVCKVDLATGRTVTVAGTGSKGQGLSPGASDALRVPLRSPWDLLDVEGEVLLIAMAGSHQIWALLANGTLGPFAGNGREALVDGPRGEASFNQPSGLATGMGHVFVADSEASAIRAIAFDGGEPPHQEPRVLTLAGQGLFVFGDVDGTGPEARLQHPVGVAFRDERVWIADTYNNKIKVLDPARGTIVTVVGSGRAGRADGPLRAAELHEPEGLTFTADGHLIIADTNNHALRLADLEAGRLQTLELAADGVAVASGLIH